MARLKLVSGHMVAKMAKNLCIAFQQWSIYSDTIWMDRMVALYWITDPERGWKVFLANRVKRIAETTGLIDMEYCPSDFNLADLWSRGATIAKMERRNWFTDSDWLLDGRQWPWQPRWNSAEDTDKESKASQEAVLCTQECKLDEWDVLLERSVYWWTMRVTAWLLGCSLVTAKLEEHYHGYGKSRSN